MALLVAPFVAYPLDGFFADILDMIKQRRRQLTLILALIILKSVETMHEDSTSGISRASSLKRLDKTDSKISNKQENPNSPGNPLQVIVQPHLSQGLSLLIEYVFGVAEITLELVFGG